MHVCHRNRLLSSSEPKHTVASRPPFLNHIHFHYIPSYTIVKLGEKCEFVFRPAGWCLCSSSLGPWQVNLPKFFGQTRHGCDVSHNLNVCRLECQCTCNPSDSPASLRLSLSPSPTPVRPNPINPCFPCRSIMPGRAFTIYKTLFAFDFDFAHSIKPAEKTLLAGVYTFEAVCMIRTQYRREALFQTDTSADERFLRLQRNTYLDMH